MTPESSANVELRLRAAVESSPSGLLMIAADGRIVLVNREVERLFGYPREELLGMSVDVLVPDRFRREHAAHRVRFFADPRVRAMGAGRELYGRRKDGTEVPVEIGLTPVATEEGMFVLSAIVDISARKNAEEEHRRLEQELRQAQKMEAIGTLAGGIAHDFNNVLGTILGYTEIARDGLPPDAAGRTALGEVLKAVDRGRQLVQRILTFSRRQEPVRRPVALAEIVGEVTELLRATLPPSIEMRVTLQPDAPRVLADPAAVQQVLMNLATNSAHAMPGGGALEVVVEGFCVRNSLARQHPELREGPYGLLTVRDTGHGMEPAVLDRAFEPFFTTKKHGAGTGLGLSMVHAIMRDHEGTVALDSTPERGTVARCFFPALQGDSDETVEETTEAPRGNGEHVLYVDDEPSLARIGEQRLTDLGYRVTLATDSQKAVELFRTSPADFDLVVTDYLMPRLTGLDLARQLGGERLGIAVIMMTGFVEDLPAETLAAAGVRRVLIKPITMPQLARAVHDVLRETRRP